VGLSHLSVSPLSVLTSAALKRLRVCRGLQPSHDNRPRRLKPHGNSQSQTFEPVFAFAVRPAPATPSLRLCAAR
jgi:hypothetical protein